MMLRNLVLALALLASPALATDVTNVSTPSGSTHGSLVNGNLPAAIGPNSIGDSGTPTASQAPPSRMKDLIADFGMVPVTAWGVSDCPVVAGSRTVTCTTTTVTPADASNNDLFVNTGGGAGSTNLDARITGYVSPHVFTIDQTPTWSTAHTVVVDQWTVSNAGLGYSFGSKQCAPGGVPQTAACGYPRLMAPGHYRINTGGTGGSGSCTLMVIAPTANSGPGQGALAGIHAVFTPVVSGGALIGATPFANSAEYKSFDGYTYTSGYYLNIPVSAAPGISGCPTGAAVDIEMSVTDESLYGDWKGNPAPNGYDNTLGVPGGLPCDKNTNAAATNTTDSGSGLTLFCTGTHTPLTSFGYDNTTKWSAALDDETTAAAANNPECVKIPTRWFMVKPIAVASHAIHGYGCVIGDASLQGGFAIFPDSGNTYPSTLGRQVLACVDCVPNGAEGPVTLQLTDPTNPNRAGMYFKNIAFLGMSTSSTQDDAITLYGPTKWPALESLYSSNVTGHLLGVGISAASGTGTIQEPLGKCLEGFRTVDTGSANDPALGFDAWGVSKGVGNNNICIDRLRLFQSPGVSFRMWPCVPGNGTHQISILFGKIELSGMEYQPAGLDAFEFGATTSDCANAVVAVSDGTTATGFSEAGVSGITLVNPDVTNNPANSIAFHFKGSIPQDVSQITMVAPSITSAGGQEGIGIQFDAQGSGCCSVITPIQNGAKDYQFVYSGSFLNQPVVYENQGTPVTAYIDGGKVVACNGGLGNLVSVTPAPDYACQILASSLPSPLPGNHPSFSASCNTIQNDNTTAYYPLSGPCPSGSGTAASVNSTPENSNATYSQMFAGPVGTPASGTITYTIEDNGSDTNVTCTVTAPAFKCNSASLTAAVLQGDHTYMKVTTAGIGGTSKVGNWMIQRDNPS